MTKILVYHVKDTRADNERSLLSEIGDGMTPINFPENHELVAEVETTKIDHELDEAYRLTQNIDRPWPQNRGVEIKIPGRNRFRSTHIGDVLVMREIPYVCSPMGWRMVMSADQRVRQ